jgi:hypothetical protein
MKNKALIFLTIFSVFLVLGILAFAINSSNQPQKTIDVVTISSTVSSEFSTSSSLTSSSSSLSSLTASSTSSTTSLSKSSSSNSPSSSSASKTETAKGKISGDLTYPSSGLIEVNACAENTTTKETICSPRKNGFDVKFEIEVPVGEYFVYSTSTFLENYRAYHDEQVDCAGGFPTTVCTAQFPNPKPIKFKVAQKANVTAMPWNWYRAS